MSAFVSAPPVTGTERLNTNERLRSAVGALMFAHIGAGPERLAALLISQGTTVPERHVANIAHELATWTTPSSLRHCCRIASLFAFAHFCTVRRACTRTERRCRMLPLCCAMSLSGVLRRKIHLRLLLVRCLGAGIPRAVPSVVGCGFPAWTEQSLLVCVGIADDCCVLESEVMLLPPLAREELHPASAWRFPRSHRLRQTRHIRRRSKIPSRAERGESKPQRCTSGAGVHITTH